MTNAESVLLIEGLKSNNKTYEMLLELLLVWHDKDSDLTDDEWSKIKEYKTTLDLFYNDPEELRKAINLNNKTIKTLEK